MLLINKLTNNILECTRCHGHDWLIPFLISLPSNDSSTFDRLTPIMKTRYVSTRNSPYVASQCCSYAACEWAGTARYALSLWRCRVALLRRRCCVPGTKQTYNCSVVTWSCTSNTHIGWVVCINEWCLWSPTKRCIFVLVFIAFLSCYYNTKYQFTSVEKQAVELFRIVRDSRLKNIYIKHYYNYNSIIEIIISTIIIYIIEIHFYNRNIVNSIIEIHFLYPILLHQIIRMSVIRAFKASSRKIDHHEDETSYILTEYMQQILLKMM